MKEEINKKKLFLILGLWILDCVYCRTVVWNRKWQIGSWYGRFFFLIEFKVLFLNNFQIYLNRMVLPGSGSVTLYERVKLSIILTVSHTRRNFVSRYSGYQIHLRLDARARSVKQCACLDSYNFPAVEQWLVSCSCCIDWTSMRAAPLKTGPKAAPA